MRVVFQAFIDKAIQELSTDTGFIGIAVAGSWLTNEIDDFSDLDLILVCNDKDFENIMKDRVEIAKRLGLLLSSFTGEHVGEPRLLICMYRDPLIHVDLKFVALKDAHERIESPSIAWERDNQLSQAFQHCSPRELKADPQWMEDRFWPWVHYGATKINRGEIFAALSLLNFLREQVLGPLALWTNQRPVRGVRRLEQYVPEISKRLEETVASYDRESCIAALKASVAIYQELRAGHKNSNLKINAEVESEVLRYLSRI